jgi:hypothetical protein
LELPSGYWSRSAGSKKKTENSNGFKSEPATRIACDKFILKYEQGKRQDNVTLVIFIKDYLETEVKHQITESSYQYQWQWARDYIIPKLVMGSLLSP